MILVKENIDNKDYHLLYSGPGSNPQLVDECTKAFTAGLIVGNNYYNKFVNDLEEFS